MPSASRFLNVFVTLLALGLVAAPSWLQAAGSPGTEVGKTYFDYQHNGACARQVTSWGDKVMTAWTYSDANSANRRAHWNRLTVTNSAQSVLLDDGSSISILPLGSLLYPSPGHPVDGTPTGASYVSLAMLPGTGASAVFFHNYPDLGWSLDDGTLGGTFAGGWVPSPPTAGDIPLWPRVVVGTQDVSGTIDTVLYVTAESQAGSGIYKSLWVWRGKLTRTGTLPSATWSTAHELDQIATLGYAIVADPGSEKVAVIYARPTSQSLGVADAQKYNNAVYYESTDAGQNWNGPTNITGIAYASPASAGSYVWADLSAVYDDQHNLHVSYVTRRWDGTAWDNTDVTLWHWDAASQTKTVVQNALWSNPCASDQFGTGNWANLLAKPTIVNKPANAGPGTGIADELLYVVWTQYGPTSTDCGQDGYTNGELYYSSSSDGGATWGTPINLSGTHTPSCAAGNCLSEGWVTAAAIADSGVYISYVEDTDPGGAVPGQGSWTESKYKVLALATAAPIPSGRLSVLPLDPPVWGDPYWTNTVIDDLGPPTGLPKSATIQVCNLGNSTLDYLVEVMPDNFGPFFVTVKIGAGPEGASAAGSINPLDPCEEITITVATLGWEGMRNYKVKVTTVTPPALRSQHVASADTLDLEINVNGMAEPTCPITMTGDVNLSGTITSADVIGLVNYVFKSGAVPSPCAAAGDINCNGTVTSADVIALVNYVFKSGAPPCDACTSALASGC